MHCILGISVSMSLFKIHAISLFVIYIYIYLYTPKPLNYASFHCRCNLKSITPLPRLTRLATFRRAKISTTAWKAFLEEDRLGQTCFSTSSNSCLGGISCQKILEIVGNSTNTGDCNMRWSLKSMTRNLEEIETWKKEVLMTSAHMFC